MIFPFTQPYFFQSSEVLLPLHGVPMSPKTDLPKKLRDNIARVIIGKDEVIELALTAFLAGGHLLVEDVPGLAKTLLARAIARSVEAQFQRVQFTPDLLPSDITGVSIYNEREHLFEFRRGPVFANILLGDELNRATPRTQSALLEAMEERQVTVDGISHPLPNPFFVMATQNPVEQQGVYPLPEAQVDRFLMQISIGYPSAADEVRIIESRLAGSPLDELKPVLSVEELLDIQKAVRRIHVDSTVSQYVVRLVDATRRHPDLILGGSPRASLSLLLSGQALAFLRGEPFVTPDLIKALAPPVLRHRLIVRPQSVLGGRTPDQIIRELLDEIPVPLLTGEFI